jgi:hypothetical protein
METLVCENCSSEWQRQPSRGRKPKLCPECLQASSVPSTKGQAPSQTTTDITYKFPAPTKWRCPSCGVGVQAGVNLNYEPTHACQKRLKRVLPLELIRS